MNLLCLVNKTNSLSRDYEPEMLTKVPESSITICSIVFEAFNKMNLQSQLDGSGRISLVSGYRPYSYQEMLFARKVNNYKISGLIEEVAVDKASKIVAKPGHSEHQLGLAIDVTTSELELLDDPLISDFEFTPQGKWLINNSYKYGFILRYPRDKKEITQIEYEPWHYRYVGIEPATFMTKNNLCLEEYILTI